MNEPLKRVFTKYAILPNPSLPQPMIMPSADHVGVCSLALS